MDVFDQHNLKFTAIKPHVVSSSDERFKANLYHFNRLCHVVKGFRHPVIGAVGARTSVFKTVSVVLSGGSRPLISHSVAYGYRHHVI